MEKGEPSLVPEWLRSNGSGTGVGCSSPHFASSQKDGPVLTLPKRNRSSKSIGNIDSPHSPLGERSSSNFWRNPSNTGSSKHDKNPFSRSYSGLNRSHCDRNGEKLTIADNWDLEYCDPLRSLISGRSEGALGRSQSLISRRQGEITHRRVSTEPRNNHSNHSDIRNGSLLGNYATITQKVSFERDFPVLGGSEERPKTPDITRVSSPGLSRGIKSNSTLGIITDSWTSALAEVPTIVVSNNIGSPPPLQSPPRSSVSSPHSMSDVRSTLNGLNMAEALVQTPPRPLTPQASAQLQRDELAVAQSKKLIPVTPSLPKALVPKSSDKLKSKTAMKTSDVSGPKNGLHRIGSVRSDGLKPCLSGKMLLLKPAREDGQPTSQTAAVDPCVFGNGHSTCASASKVVSNNMKPVEKKCSQSQLQSRNDFFNLVRKKSMSNSSVTPGEGGGGGGGEVKCNNGVCELVERSSNNSVNDSCEDVVIHPNEEEEAFLRSLGWEDSAADEGGLTEEEINAFVHKLKIMTRLDHMKWKPGSKLYEGLLQ